MVLVFIWLNSCQIITPGLERRSQIDIVVLVGEGTSLIDFRLIVVEFNLTKCSFHYPANHKYGFVQINL